MKRFFLLFFILILYAGCVNGPAVIETYSSQTKGKSNLSNVYFYKILVEGDNFDPYVENIILDKVNIYFKKLNINLKINNDIFKNDIDVKDIKFSSEILNNNYNYMLVFIVRVKDLGYSIATLSEETNIFINASLYDKNGELATSSLFSKITSYSLSASKRFHWDIVKALDPIKKYIASKPLK